MRRDINKKSNLFYFKNKQRFSIRKLAVSTASVLLGITFLGGMTNTAKADTVGVPDSKNGQGELQTYSNLNKKVVQEKESASTEKLLQHNAYIYDAQGKRTNDLNLKSGSIVATYGTKDINGRHFYDLGQDLYLAAGNIDNQLRKLKHNSYVYDQWGQKTANDKKLQGETVKTYGDPVKIAGKIYYAVGTNQYIKQSNFVIAAEIPKRPGYVAGLVVNGKLRHNAYVYDTQGKRTNKVILNIGSKMYAAVSETINGHKFYEFGNNQRIAAGNIDGIKQKLTHNAYIYNKYGQRIGKKVLKAGKQIRTYGDSMKIKQASFYAVGDNRFVKQTNFE